MNRPLIILPNDDEIYRVDLVKFLYLLYSSFRYRGEKRKIWSWISDAFRTMFQSRATFFSSLSLLPLRPLSLSFFDSDRLYADGITKERASRSIKSNEHPGEAAEFEHRRMEEEGEEAGLKRVARCFVKYRSIRRAENRKMEQKIF